MILYRCQQKETQAVKKRRCCICKNERHARNNYSSVMYSNLYIVCVLLALM